MSLDLPPAPPWMERGACKTEDPALFFPETSSHTVTIRRAKAICARCPVIQQCDDWATERDERYGIWGGRTEGQRAKLRKEAKA